MAARRVQRSRSLVGRSAGPHTTANLPATPSASLDTCAAALMTAARFFREAAIQHGLSQEIFIGGDVVGFKGNDSGYRLVIEGIGQL